MRRTAARIVFAGSVIVVAVTVAASEPAHAGSSVVEPSPLCRTVGEIVSTLTRVSPDDVAQVPERIVALYGHISATEQLAPPAIRDDLATIKAFSKEFAPSRPSPAPGTIVTYTSEAEGPAADRLTKWFDAECVPHAKGIDTSLVVQLGVFVLVMAILLTLRLLRGRRPPVAPRPGIASIEEAIQSLSPVPRGPIAVITVEHPSNQRLTGLLIGLLSAGLAVLVPLLAIGGLTVFRDEAGSAKWLLLVVAGPAAYQFGATATTCWRIVRRRPTRLELADDRLVVDDPSLFTAPLVVPRSHVDAVALTPSGFEFRRFARSEPGVLLNLVAEQPTLMIRLTDPISFPQAQRRNNSLRHGASVPAPRPGRPARALYLRIDDPADLKALRQWGRPSSDHLDAHAGEKRLQRPRVFDW